MTDRLKGKVAFVTGIGSSGPGWGIGKAIAARFAQEGALVYGIDRNPKAADLSRQEIQAMGGNCEVEQADVTDEDAIAGAIEACVKRFGGLDILVNNVGMVTVGGPVELETATWQKVLDTNLSSMFLTAKYAIPHMQERGKGSIVHIGSVAGIRYTGVPYVAYASTKAAVLGLSRTIALQYARKQIRSNVIMPGLMNTPYIVEPLKGAYGGGDVAKMLAVRDEQCPMGFMGDAWDVAHAALFLASDEARYVTGAELVVDGGLTSTFA
jgi:NAD(P)-dependent dehydrogenase (short-subunit alcohol dehydrogenase family)